MAAITYTANSRAPLVTDSPAHTAGTDYSIDVKLRAYGESIETPKSSHISLGGNVEEVLQRASDVYSAVLIWPPTLNASMREFLYSVAAGEVFTFDPYGTVASADDPASMVCMNTSYNIGRLTHGKEHWRSVSLTIRPAI
jgi:hypothetical protein